MITREQYIQFLIHTPVNYTGSYLAEHLGTVSHDTVSDFLKKQPIAHTTLWKQTKELIHDTQESCLIIDDSVQEKPYARAIELVYPHYSGNKHRVVQGIDIVNLVHSSGQSTFYPVDYRIYAPQYQKEKKTKNDYFLEMLRDAFEIKKIQARYILFDSWYGSFQNLNYIHQSDHIFYTTLHKDRLVSLSKDEGYIHLQDIKWDDALLASGIKIKLKRTPYIFTLFKIVAEDANIDWVITNDPDPDITSDRVKQWLHRRWDIECFHRELKQLTGIEKCQCHAQQSQRHHIMYCYLAWVSLAKHARSLGKTIYHLKMSLISDYMRNQLQNPCIPVLNVM